MIDFELMRFMGWSWEDLEATPPYVKQYCWDLMQARLAAENNAHRAAREANRRA